MSRSALAQPRPASLSASPVTSRAVLIGTLETVAQAREQLALLEGAPEPVGCILLGPMQARAAGGLPVLGSVQQLEESLRAADVQVAVVSLPLAMGEMISQVRALLGRAGIAERFVPSLRDMLMHPPPLAIGMGAATTSSVAAAGKIDVADLIDRRPRGLDRASIARILTGKRVLISGAGGSIGSELARIVAEFEPEQLQLVERAENPLFEIDRQISRRFAGLHRRTVLHDVVDAEQTRALLVDLRPHVVFHAAAHKHVPLMEDHPAHAVTNNLFGTKSIADASLATGVERFVMVSSDKAVNPTSVMGATKRLAELYIHWLHDSGRQISGSAATRFSMVRFGNVLGSSCSVLAIWTAQMAEGGPITVTDPRMTRFFMTIPEAATLVIQAGAIEYAPGEPAAVHVLDMGEPLRILDLAQRFVRAHGFEPRVCSADGQELQPPQGSGLPVMDICLSGIRPGEKLYEELSYGAEQLRETGFAGIRAWADAAAGGNCAAMVAELAAVRTSRDREAVQQVIRRHVPEMR
jgi:FlaA1/EpsC-like NDP-sugar epimerase